MKDLAQIRERIDHIDREISRLFLERMEASADVAEYKRATGKPIYDPIRERANIAAASDRVPAEYASYAAVLQSVLMDASREAQHKALDRTSDVAKAVQEALAASPAYFPEQATVVCQGVEGAYQQIACERMFRRPSISFVESFGNVMTAVEQGEADFGVLPIENSTAGSVNLVYDLLRRHECHIVRSCRLRVDHNLLVRPGTRLEDVRVVYSHEQAIRQCAEYIARIPDCRIHVCENTAKAAELVSKSDHNDVAAIASRSCAAIYGLEVADRTIQDSQSNYTRFVCLAKDLVIYPGADRLARFYSLGINLLKLESRPIPNRDFEFMFYFDIDCQVAAPVFETLMNSLSDVCEEFRYLGSYSEVF